MNTAQNKAPGIIEIDGQQYRLTFFDDFEGDCLDLTKWTVCPPWQRQDVGGYWDARCVSLDGKGNLVLHADINEKGVPISGGIRSIGKFEQARGYFSCRCKVQRAPGFWGAFWLMCEGERSVGNGAVDGAEIDIFESCHVADGCINHAIHWDGYGEHHRQLALAIKDSGCYDGEYHTYSLLWTDQAYIFYIDGKETYRIAEGDDNFPGSSREACYLKLTTEFGRWAGVYDKASLPDCIKVDYVKVYAKL